MEPEAYNSRVWHNKGNKASYTNPQGIYTASSDEQSLFHAKHQWARTRNKEESERLGAWRASGEAARRL